MLSIFFKRKDYKEVTVKYLDQLTNDIEKLQVKRIAGMTAANELTSKNVAYMEASHTVEKSQNLHHKAPRDSHRSYDDSIREVSRDRPSHSYHSSGSRHQSALLADFQDGNTSLCSTLVTSENKTCDSLDIPVSGTTKKSRTLSRKVMAESIENMLREVVDLKTKFAVTVISCNEDVKKASASLDSMVEEINGLKAMITLIIAEQRKNAAGSAEINSKLREEVEGLKSKLNVIATITSERESRFMSCATFKIDDSSSDVDEKEHPLPTVRKKENQWLDRDYYCRSSSYKSCQDCFSFIKCASNLD